MDFNILPIPDRTQSKDVCLGEAITRCNIFTNCPIFESIYFLAVLNMQNHKAYIHYNLILFHIVVERNLIFGACWLDAGFMLDFSRLSLPQDS